MDLFSLLDPPGRSSRTGCNRPPVVNHARRVPLGSPSSLEISGIAMDQSLLVVICCISRTARVVGMPGSAAHQNSSWAPISRVRSEEHTSELQSSFEIACRLLL